MLEKTPINSLKKGKYIMVEGEPCKIMDMESSKPGKHGHAKVRIEAVGLFDSKKRNIVSPSHAEMDVPIIDKRVGQVLSVHEGKVQLMDTQSFETMDLPIPSDFEGEVKEGGEVVYWDVLGRRLLRGK